MAQEQRECGMMTTTGVQGVGKTYQNMHIIHKFVQDKLTPRVPGRRALILDVNGEYVREEWEKAGITNFEPKRLALSDIPDWWRYGPIEARRVDAKDASIAQKKEALEYIVNNYRNGLLQLDDINNFILTLSNMEEIVGRIISLRHRGVDVIMSFQSLRPVEPRIWGNSRWVRMHYQADDVADIKDKVTDPILFKIAQLLVNNRYFGGDERFFCYIHNFKKKLEGDFTKEEFNIACEQYLNINQRDLKSFMRMKSIKSEPDAISEYLVQFNSRYYGNQH